MDKRVETIKKNLGRNYFISKDSRHIRWGYEPSGDFDFDNEMVKYHFVFVDDSDFDRKKIRDRIYEKISGIDSRICGICEVTGKVGNGKMGYLYTTFNSIVAPKFLKLGDIGIPVRFDRDLKSRKVLTVMDYIIRIYE